MLSKVTPTCLFAYLCIPIIMSNEETRKYSTCKTPVCYDFAEQLEANIDSSVDPCDDFYGYACGGFVKRYKGDQNSRRIISTIQPILDSRVHDILQGEYGSSPPFMREATDFYKQCESFNLTEDSAWKHLFDHVELTKKEYIGSWPFVTPSWNESEFDLNKAFMHLKTSHWMGAIYDIAYKNNDSETKFDLGITLDTIPITMNNFQNIFAQVPSSIAVRVYSIEEVARRYHDTHSVKLTPNQVTNDLLDMMQFYKQLSEIAANAAAQNQIESFTLAEVQEISKAVNWIKIFKATFGYEAISEKQKVYGNKFVLKQADELLQRTSKRTISNVVFWKFLFQYLSSLGNCFHVTKDAFKHAIGAAYVEKFVEQTTIQKIQDDLFAVRAAFKRLLSSTEWMDNRTRERAQEKLRLIDAHIVVSNTLNNHKKLRDYYQPFKFSVGKGPRMYLKNMDAIQLLNAQIMKNIWDKKAIKAMEILGTLVTNAVYNPQDNSIAVFAGLLVQPFYHPNLPMAVNYGTIVYVLGHELTHAFDNKGRLYDKNGNKVNWWSDYSSQEYNKRYKCYIDNYAKLAKSDFNATATAIRTAGENIADGGGLKEAYEALKLKLNASNVHERLPGTMSKYTLEQLYFLSFGNLFCSHLSDMDKFMETYDVHSSSYTRVNGAVMNIKPFAEAFKCAAGSNMNPVKKCSLFE